MHTQFLHTTGGKYRGKNETEAGVATGVRIFFYSIDKYQLLVAFRITASRALDATVDNSLIVLRIILPGRFMDTACFFRCRRLKYKFALSINRRVPIVIFIFLA